MRILLWFKRDLRLADHAPLVEATGTGTVLPVFFWEPLLEQDPAFTPAKRRFLLQTLAALRQAIAAKGGHLWLGSDPLPQGFARLHQAWPFNAIYAHEQTSLQTEFERDQAVAAWCRHQGIILREFPANGVVRRLRSRDGWSRLWDQRMRPQPLPVPSTIHWATPPCPSDILPEDPPGPPVPPAGEIAAHQTLDSFLHHRGMDYTRLMSKPGPAQTACSRISEHLAFGSLSIRQGYHAMLARRRSLLEQPPSPERTLWLRALKSFEARLHWHCHFIQKLEDAPNLDRTELNPAYAGLRPPLNRTLHRAWERGETGYPLIDACMRCLAVTGWINFRMRAMLVSFYCYDLWGDWREAGQTLARLFLDYEPGIHWAQVQMQAGTTGYNTPRMYNPTKQITDHDPQGIFIRQWVPELARVPPTRIAEPWTMTPSEQREAGCVIGADYPAPIVEHETAIRRARTEIARLRRDPATRQLARVVLKKHGSRRHPDTPRRSPPSPQLPLF